MKKLFIVLLIGLWPGLTFAEQSGKQLTASCAACHGPEGNSNNALWPKLAGQHANYLVAQMLAFKKGQQGGRFNSVMSPLMAKLTSQDLQDIAAYYASQKTQIGAADPKLVQHGEQLYRGGDISRHIVGCIACHGPTGSGNAQANFPKLAGQQAQYVQQQLINFQNGSRSNDLNHIMRDIALQLDQKDMTAVASYIAGLH